MKRRLFYMLTCVLICFSLNAAAESKGIFYRVHGGKNEMTLLGSIHVGAKEMYPWGDVIIHALENADMLVFECDTEAPEELDIMKDMMFYPAGDTLDQHISSETLESMKQVASTLGYPYDFLNTMKPWAIVSMMSTETTAVEMGTTDVHKALELGVEEQIKKTAGNKETLYLESVKEQLDIMDSFSEELQEYMLQTACATILQPDEISGMDATLKKWPLWWANGDDEAFSFAYTDSMSIDPRPTLMQEYHNGLIVKRNEQMVQTLCTMLEAPEDHSFFVTIGLLHLVLPQDSVIDGLESQGYWVEKIE